MIKNTPKYLLWLVIYVYFSGILYILMNFEGNLKEILTTRAIFSVFLGLIWACSFIKNEKYRHFAQFLLAYSSLGVLYKDTALLNTLFFDKIDQILIWADDVIFGFQPSVRFSEVFHQKWFSELMFAGYFFYYLFPVILSVYILRFKSEKIVEFANLLIISFIIYYCIFILLPAQGPQYQLAYPENYIASQGIFADIVKLIQKNGEAPTAAFPSSHVGMSVIWLLWLYRNEKKLLKIFIPPVLVLCFSTIYIKAHYAVDVFFGLISSVIIYKILNHFLLKPKNTSTENL